MSHTRVPLDLEQLIEHLGALPEPVAEPVFILVSGLPGTGKSYFSRKLTERIPLVVIESDDLRKFLFKAPTYSQDESSYLFDTCHHLIEYLLKRGISVILDATNLSERNRECLYTISERLGAKLIIISLEAPPNIVKERLQTRANNSDNKSDADWTIYNKMKPMVEKISRTHYVIDTSNDITPSIDKIVRDVNRRRR